MSVNGRGQVAAYLSYTPQLPHPSGCYNSFTLKDLSNVSFVSLGGEKKREIENIIWNFEVL